jgi:hypothetical protein
VRKLFRRRWVKALAVALTLVVLPFLIICWLSTSADRQLQSEKDRLSALGFPMTLEERKAYFNKKGRNAGEFLDELGRRYVALKHKTPLPDEDPTPFLKDFHPLLQDFLKIHNFDSYYRDIDYSEQIYLGTSRDIRPHEVMKAALFCAEQACKKGDVERAIVIFEAADHFSNITALRGNLDAYILGISDSGRVGVSYTKCASKLKTRELVQRLLESAERRKGMPLPGNAYILQPGIEARLYDAMEERVREEFDLTLMDYLRGGLPETEQEWVHLIPHLRTRMTAQQLAIWRRFAERMPENKADWRAYQSAYETSYQELAEVEDMVSRTAIEHMSDEDYASQFYINEKLRRKARLMGMRIVAGISHEPEIDIFTGDSLKVRRDKLGILVYSVGPNLVDDNGEEDDIRIAIRYNPVLSKN